MDNIQTADQSHFNAQHAFTKAKNLLAEFNIDADQRTSSEALNEMIKLFVKMPVILASALDCLKNKSNDHSAIQIMNELITLLKAFLLQFEVDIGLIEHKANAFNNMVAKSANSLYMSLTEESKRPSFRSYCECSPRNCWCYILFIEDNQMKLPNAKNSRYSFNEGDIISVNPAAKPVHKNYVIVRDKQKEINFMRQYFIKGNKHYLKANNPNFPTMAIADHIEIIGVVTGTQINHAKQLIFKKELKL